MLIVGCGTVIILCWEEELKYRLEEIRIQVERNMYET